MLKASPLQPESRPSTCCCLQTAHRSLTGAPGSLQMSVAMPTVPTPEMTASASAFTSSREAPAAAAAPATCVAHTLIVSTGIH